MDSESIEMVLQWIREVNEEIQIDEPDVYYAGVALLEDYQKLKALITPQPMATAPKDGTPIWIRTENKDWVEGYWDAETPDFYKSDSRFSSYDPENNLGTWVANYACDADGDRRLFCGMTPNAWLQKLPHEKSE